MSLTMKKQKRIEEVLHTIQVMGFATRSQLQAVHNLKSERNALKFLSSLKPWVHVKPSPERNNEGVYYLNKAGCELMGVEEERRWVQTVEHYLMRNDMYIHYGMPEDFTIEPEINLGSGLTLKILRPDAYFVKDGLHYFLEVDRTQKMLENKKKIESYKELNPYLKGKYNSHPYIVFFTSSHIRQKKLQSWCNEHGVQCEVYTKDDLR
jgi:Replication-relaxation